HQQTLDAAQPLQDQLVAGVELDTGLAVDALCAELGAELALWLRAVASGLAGPADLALCPWVSIREAPERRGSVTYSDGGSSARVVDGGVRIPALEGVDGALVARCLGLVGARHDVRAGVGCL